MTRPRELGYDNVMRIRSRWAWILPSGAVTVLVALQLHAAATSDTSRYPYDPACAWGRIADGRGMLVRCLDETEARALAQGRLVAVAPSAPNASPAPPDAAAPDGGAPDAAAPLDRDIELSVGPVVPEQGKLARAEQKLALPRERYLGCLAEHGGLQRSPAEVVVRFLVQAPRGRAEGVEVVEQRGMTPAAARCIADVIDRRAVGTPDAPLTGVRATLKFQKPKR